jgi:hypothetical protein
MTDVVERLLAGTGGGKHWMELHEEAASEIKRLRKDAERYMEELQAKVDAIACPWQPMGTAPKDGFAVLVLVDGSDIPRAARWLRGPDDPHATEMTAGPGWHLTWDGTPVPEHDGPRYWMHCPDDPDA